MNISVSLKDYMSIILCYERKRNFIEKCKTARVKNNYSSESKGEERKYIIKTRIV